MSDATLDVARGYDAVADRILMSDAFYRDVLDLLPPLGPGRRILDLGAGQGRLLELLGAARPEALFGGDLSSELCRRARARGCPRIVRLDARRPPFAPESFAAVLLTEVLEHLADPGAALAAVCATLEPGGFLLLTVPNRAWPRYRKYQRRHAAFQPVDDHWFRPEELVDLVEAAGLVVRRIAGHGSLFGGALLHRGLAALLHHVWPGSRRRRKRLLLLAQRAPAAAATAAKSSA